MSNYSLFKLIGSTLALVLLSVPGNGQKAWEKRPYQQWAQYETAQIIFDSPWAKTFHAGSLYDINVRLHSALTLRQALLRLRQLRMNYDGVSAHDKARAETQTRAAFECADCAKYYIVTIAPIPADKEVLSWLSNLSVEELKQHVFLENENGDRRNLVAFIQPRPADESLLFVANAVFYFERFDQGKPLISAQNKKLYFSIDEKIFKGGPLSFGKITFDVSKLVRNEVVF